MEFNRKQLLDALQAAASVVSKKPALPILADVLGKATPSGVEFIASDLTSTSSTFVECEDAEPFCAPAADLLGFVSALNCDAVAIKLTGSRVEVSGGGAKFSTSFDYPRDYPEVKLLDDVKGASVEPSDVIGMLRGTSFAASCEIGKPHLSGVALVQTKSGVDAVSTDGHRMALRSYKAKIGKTCIVPSIAANAIADMLDGTESCSVAFADGYVQVTAGHRKLSAKLVEAQPIPYAQFFAPGGWVDIPAVINRAALVSSLKRVLVVRGDDYDGTLSMADGKLTISRSTPTKSAEESISVDCQEAASTHCSLRYLAESIDHIDGETVELHIGGELDPIRMRNQAGDRMAIVMPCRK